MHSITRIPEWGNKIVGHLRWAEHYATATDVSSLVHHFKLRLPTATLILSELQARGEVVVRHGVARLASPSERKEGAMASPEPGDRSHPEPETLDNAHAASGKSPEESPDGQVETSEPPATAGLHPISPPSAWPSIIVNNRQLRHRTSEALDSLSRRNHPQHLFVRNGRLVSGGARSNATHIARTNRSRSTRRNV